METTLFPLDNNIIYLEAFLSVSFSKMTLYLEGWVPMLVLYLVLNIFGFLSLPLVYKYRNEEMLRKRLPIFIFFQTITTMIGVNYYIYICNEKFLGTSPNFVTLWINHEYMILFYGSNLLRDIYIIFLHTMNLIRSCGDRKTAADTLQSLNRVDFMVLRCAIYLNTFLKGKVYVPPRLEVTLKSRPSVGSSVEARSVKDQDNLSTSNNNNNNTNNNTNTNTFTTNTSTEVESKNIIQELTSLSSFNGKDLIKAATILFTFITLICLVIVIAIPDVFGIIPTVTDYNKIQRGSWIPLIGFTCVYLVLKPLTLYSQRNIKQFGIWSESLATALAIGLSMFCYIILDSKYLPRFAYPMAAGIEVILFSNYFPVLWLIVKKGREKKKQPDIEKNVAQKSQTFNELLDKIKSKENHESYLRLKKIMTETMCIENLIFHEEYLHFMDHIVAQGDPKKGLQELKRFQIKFINPNSPFELNLSHDSRSKFLSLSDGDFDGGKRALARIEEEVRKLIYSNSFNKFLEATTAKSTAKTTGFNFFNRRFK